MNATGELTTEYLEALQRFVDQQSETAMSAAADIGKQAIARELGILDLAILHHDCLQKLLARCDRADDRQELLRTASSFFCETLAPFEMSHRGFLELSQTVTRMIQLAAVVCHELRSPLSSLVTSLGLLREIIDPQPGGNEAKLLGNIERSAEILKLRTDDLLDLVAFQQGTLRLDLEEVDVEPIVHEVSQTLMPQCTVAGLELHTQVQPGLLPLRADRRRIGQVLSNLIENALKYGAQGGRIDVRAYAEPKRIVIEVQDYGSGVAMWEKLKIFRSTYRSPQSAHEVPGLGIGLALCKEIISRHHGTITVESEEGRGTQFRVTLPSASAEPGEALS